MSKQTVVFDFDGVIHRYSNGWKGANIIDDIPITGIREAIHDIRQSGYYVVIVSTRCRYDGGINSIKSWLNNNNIEYDDIMADKPPAIVYIDDRAICFDGHPETLLSKISNFKPYNATERS